MNKNFLIFINFAFVLFNVFLAVMFKLISLMFKEAVFYCQLWFNSFTVRLSHPLILGFVSLLMVSLLAALVRALLLVRQPHFLSRKLQDKIPLQPDLRALVGKLGLKGKVSLLKDSKPFAYCAGIRNPRIYFSTAIAGMMDEKEIEAILRHERYHLRNKDPLLAVFISTALILFPFFPLLADLLRRHRIEREIKADREAIEGIGDEQPLISVLKKLLICRPNQPNPFTAVVGLSDDDTLEYRIRALITGKHSTKKFNLRNVAVSFLSISLIIAFLLTPIQALEPDQYGDDFPLVCRQSQECFIWCKS